MKTSPQENARRRAAATLFTLEIFIYVFEDAAFKDTSCELKMAGTG